MRKIYSIFNVLTNIVTWSVIICVVFFVCTLYVPRFFGTEPFIVLSSSMEPAIHTGSLVYISETDDELQVDDIVAYKTGDASVVHRITERTENGSYITKGDANANPDMNEVTRSQVLGKCTLIVPSAGYFLSALRSHVFHVGSVTMPVVIPITVGVLISMYLIQCIMSLLIKDEDDN